MHKSRAWKLGLPPAVSLLVHGMLLALLLLITISVEPLLDEPTQLAELASTPTSDSRAPEPPQPEPSTRLSPPAPNEAVPPVAAPTQDRDLAALLPTLEAAGLQEPAPSDDFMRATTLPAAPSGLNDPGAASVPELQFAGLRAHAAERIVYVVDGSGAVVPTLPYLKDNLMRSIDKLAPTQRFNIIFFRELTPAATDLEPRPSFADELVNAVPANRNAAADWIDGISAAGRSDPTAALREAFALRPDLIFVLSTSIQRTQTDTSDRKARLLLALDELNPLDPRTGRRATVIKTLQFLRDDPANLLRDVATIHGDGSGSFRLLTADTLGLDQNSTSTQTPTPDSRTEQRLAEAADTLQAAEALGWVVRLGLPTAEETEQIRVAMNRVLDILDDIPADERTARWGAILQRASLLLDGATPDSPSRPILQRGLDRAPRGVLLEPAADAERRFVRAMLEALLNQAHASEAVPDFAAESFSESLRLRSRLASRVLGQRSEPLTVATQTDPAARLLLAQAETRARLATNQDDADAFAPLLALRENAGWIADPFTRERVVDERIAATQGLGLDWANAPAAAALSRARHLARSQANRAEGLQALDRLIARPGLDSTIRAEALWLAAIVERTDAETNPETRGRVRTRLMTLAQDHPESARARAATAAAIALGGSPDGALDPDLPNAFISFALTTFADHPAADRWWLGLALRAADGTRLSVLENIPPGSPEQPRAVALYLETVARLGTTDALERTLGFTRPRDREAWIVHALQLAEALEVQQPLHAAAASRAAELYLALADPSIVHPRFAADDLTLRAGRVLAQGAQADPALAGEAVAILTELALRLEQQQPRPTLWQHAWVLTLEAIANHGDESARADARAHLARLQLIDPGLGGDPWAARFIAVQESLDSLP